jgi:hypothetical protein
MSSFPPITLIIFLLGLILLLKGKVKNLAYLASFSFIFHNAFITPFGVHFRPNQLIYFLLILLFLISSIYSTKKIFIFDKKFDKPLLYSIYTIPASILANILSTGDLSSPTQDIGFGSTVQSSINDLIPISINSGLITQNIYVIFPLFLFFFLRKLDIVIIKKCIEYFIYAVAFLTLFNVITAIEIILFNGTFLTNVTNILTGREGAYGNTIGLGFTRIGGFVGEPAHYAYVTLPAFGYTMGKVMTDINNNRKWKLFSLLFLFGLLISFSTTGFVSVILFMTIFSIYNYRKKTYIFMVLLSFVLIFTGFLFFADLINAFLEYNMSKLISGQGSFAIRMWSIKHNLNLLLNHPLFGIGVGSGGALGGFVTVITNIGLIGVTVLYFCFRDIFPIHSKSILFGLLALFIHNLTNGDLSTFFSPIFSLFLAYAANKKLSNISKRQLEFN